MSEHAIPYEEISAGLLAPESDPEPAARAAPTTSSPRIAKSVIDGELRQPIEALQRTLQRLSIQHVGAAAATSPATHLLRRARTLVDDLDRVIDEIADLAAPSAGPVLRSGQERIPLEPLLRDVADEVTHHFGRAHTLTCGDDLDVTTDPGRLRAILVNLFAAAARNGAEAGFAIDAVTVNRIASIVVTWSSAAHAIELLNGDPGLVLAQTLTRSLGGELKLSDGDATDRIARITFPQQRDGDSTDRFP